MGFYGKQNISKEIKVFARFHNLFFMFPRVFNRVLLGFLGFLAFTFFFFPQQPERLRGSSNNASGWFGAAAGNAVTRFREVPKEWNRFRSQGSIHKTLGSERFREVPKEWNRFRSEGSIHETLGSERFRRNGTGSEVKVPFMKR